MEHGAKPLEELDRTGTRHEAYALRRFYAEYPGARGRMAGCTELAQMVHGKLARISL